jgi:uncharacterized protein (TIGR02246 family)
MKRWIPFAIGMLLAAGPLRAEENKEIHDELRALRDELIAAVNAGDPDKLMSYLHPNCVVTWQDGTCCRGRDGVRAYYNKMMTGPKAIVRSFKTDLKVDELTILYGGDAGIAFGSSEDQFKLSHGRNFTLHDRWTATVVKEDGRWQVAACHVSTSPFDNPLLAAVKRGAIAVGAIAGIVGVALGLFIGRRRKVS